MSESPDAIRKYIAPSPRPVIVSSTKVLMGQPLPHKQGEGMWGNLEVPPHEARRRGLVGERWFPPRERAGGERRSSGDSEEAAHLRRVGEQRACVAAMDDTPLVEHDCVPRDPPHNAEVLLDEQDGGELARPLEYVGDLRHEEGRETLGRL